MCRPKMILVLLALLLALPAAPAGAQGGSITPRSGPPGTPVTVITTANGVCRFNSDPGGTIVTQDEVRLGEADASNTLRFIIPRTAQPNRTYYVHCTRGEFSYDTMAFYVTDPQPVYPDPDDRRATLQGPEAVFRPGTAGTALNGNRQITAADLVSFRGGGLGISVPVDNAQGQTLIVTVRGPDPQRILEYVNTVRMSFQAVSYASQNIRGFPVQGPFSPQGSPPANPTITVDLTLLTSNMALPANQQYVIYYLIDPLIQRAENHYYPARQAHSFSVQAWASTGTIRTMMSSLYQGNYWLAQNEHSAGASLPEPLSSYTFGGWGSFDATISGLASANEYEIRGGFVDTAMCQASDATCIQNNRPELLAPGECRFEIRETFDNNAAQSTWFQETASGYSVGFANGAYRLQINSAWDTSDYRWLWGSLQNVVVGDGTVEAQVRMPVTSDPERFAEVGLWIRFQDRFNFIAFKISNRGQYRFARWQNENYTDLVEGAWLAHSAINTQGDNVLRVTSSGNQFDFYINDEYVGTARDSTWSEGRIAFFGSAHLSALPATFYLDSITICGR